MNFRMYGIVVHQFRKTVLVFFDYLTIKMTFNIKEEST